MEKWLNSSKGSRTTRDIRDYIKAHTKPSKGTNKSGYEKTVLGVSQSGNILENSTQGICRRVSPESSLEQATLDDFITKMKRKRVHSRRTTEPVEVKSKTLPASCITRGVRRKKGGSAPATSSFEASIYPRNKSNDDLGDLTKRLEFSVEEPLASLNDATMSQEIDSSQTQDVSPCVFSVSQLKDSPLHSSTETSQLCPTALSYDKDSGTATHATTATTASHTALLFTNPPEDVSAALSPPPPPHAALLFSSSQLRPSPPPTPGSDQSLDAMAPPHPPLSPRAKLEGAEVEGELIDTDELLAELSYCEKLSV